MTIKYTFFIGLNDKDSKVQEMDTVSVYKIVQRVFINHGVDGVTLMGAQGIYRHNADLAVTGEKTPYVVTEYSILVKVFEFGDAVPVRAICEDLKSLLNQESIAVEKRETDSVLY